MSGYGLIMGKSVNAFLAKAGSLIVELKERADVSPFIVSELNALFPKVKEAMAKIKELETNIESIAKTLKHYDLFQSALGGKVQTALIVLEIASENMKGRRTFAMGNRYAGISRTGNAGSNPRDNLHRNTAFHQIKTFLAAAAKNVRVAAL